MEEILEKTADMLKIDRSNWELVKFGDVAIQQKETVDRENSELTRYVKGEHMGSEDLHLRKWGELEDEYLGPAFIRKFSEGDILYGSRRTYLRKVVLAPFEGITSNTTFVIKANEKKIDKGLLPFVMMSEGFTDNSIKNSKGSVNPYINWKDIANYEFLLPPKDQQAQLAELLWAMDEVLESRNTLTFDLFKFLDILLIEFLTEKAVQCKWPYKRIAELASKKKYSCIGGPFGSNLTSKHYVDYEGVPVIRGTNLSGGSNSFNENDFVYVSEEKSLTLYRNLAFPGDLVITQRGTMGQVGLIPKSTKHEKFVISQSQMKLTVDEEKALPQYLYYFFVSKLGQELIKNATIATGVPHINLGIFKDFKIITPPLKDQMELVREIDSLQNSITHLSQSLISSQALQKSLINQIF